MLVQLQKDYPNDVRIVYRLFPLTSIHPLSIPSARAAEAADVQGKFIEMQSALMEHQQDWSQMTPEDFDKYLKETVAPEVGLDVTQFTTDLASQAVIDKVDAEEKSATTIGLPGTPFLLINSVPYQGQNDYESLASIVKLYQMQEQQYMDCPPMTIDSAKSYTATVKTTKGDVVIQLYADKAPMTVNNFIFLAKEGWYNNAPFHRVIPGFVAQTGDPSGTGYGGPGYTFSNEVDPSLRFDKEGVLGMANAGPDSNGSQFFITYGPEPALDGSYTVFGQVVSGMDVVTNLQARDASQGGPLADPDRIVSITFQEN